MARLALSARPAEQLQSGDLLAGDHIGFDAWLLPPEAPSARERMIRRVSSASGPILFVIALACTIRWIA